MRGDAQERGVRGDATEPHNATGDESHNAPERGVQGVQMLDGLYDTDDPLQLCSPGTIVWMGKAPPKAILQP